MHAFPVPDCSKLTVRETEADRAMGVRQTGFDSGSKASGGISTRSAWVPDASVRYVAVPMIRIAPSISAWGALIVASQFG